MKIEKINKLEKHKNLIVLSKKQSKFKNLKFSKNELKYIKKQLEDNRKIIEINRYDYSIFVITINQDEEIKIQQEKARKLANDLFKILDDRKIRDLNILNDISKSKIALSIIEGLLLSNYSFLKYKTKDIDKYEPVIKTIKLKDKFVTANQLSTIKTIIDGVYLARDLVNEPLSGLNSVDFSEKLKKISENAGYKIEILNKKQIEALKMNGLLTVNRASDIPPTFSILEWNSPKAKNKKPIVLVGKGIVFDTGGYNLKPGKHMNDMKADMAGAAAVAGIIYVVSKLQLPVSIIGLIPATDNMIGRNAYVTGDVIEMYNGTTVEVLNTDAEGRLILADALSYAKKYDPELVIDIATLTGSAMVALDSYASAMMTNTENEIKNKLLQAADNTYERVVEFPLWDEYGEGLKSNIADLKNISNSYAGHITAAKFLENFCDYPWIHLDIAATALMKKKFNYQGIGATGIPVRLLVNFIENYI